MHFQGGTTPSCQHFTKRSEYCRNTSQSKTLAIHKFNIISIKGAKNPTELSCKFITIIWHIFKLTCCFYSLKHSQQNVNVIEQHWFFYCISYYCIPYLHSHSHLKLWNALFLLCALNCTNFKIWQWNWQYLVIYF